MLTPVIYTCNTNVICIMLLRQ